MILYPRITSSFSALFLAISLSLLAPIQAQEKPELFFTVLGKAMEQGRADIAAQVLPVRYRTDLERSIRSFASRTDPKIFKDGATTLRRTVSVLEAKKGVILKLAAREKLPLSRDVLNQYDRFVQMARVLSESEISNQASLSRFDLLAFLGDEGNKLLALINAMKFVTPEARSLKAPLDILPQMKARTIYRNPNGALVELLAVGEKVSVPMMQVDGRWLPVDVKKGLEAFLENLRTKVGGADLSGASRRKDAASLFILLANGILDDIEKAQDENQLLAALSPIGIMLQKKPDAAGDVQAMEILRNGQAVHAVVKDLAVNLKRPSYPVAARHRNSTDYFKVLAQLNGDNNFMMFLGHPGDPGVTFGRPETLTPRNNRWCVVEGDPFPGMPFLLSDNLRGLRSLSDPNLFQLASRAKGPVMIIYHGGEAELLKNPQDVVRAIQGKTTYNNRVLSP